MDDLVKRATRRLKASQKAHEATFKEVLNANTRLRDGRVAPGDLVDLAYVYRSIAAIADDTRKECTALMELAERMACMRWVTEHTNDPEAAKAIHGELAVGVPDLKMMASLPKPSTKPAEYKALMMWLGVPADMHMLVRPHWPALTDLLTQLAAEGKPLPPGVDANKTYPVYRLLLREKKGQELEG